MDGSKEKPYSINPHRVTLPISIAYARHLVKILQDVGNDRANRAVNSLCERIEGAIARNGSSIYSYNHRLSNKDVVNGEIHALLNALEFYASIYEKGTADVMLAARELIMRMIENPKRYKRTLDRENILAAIDAMAEEEE